MKNPRNCKDNFCEFLRHGTCVIEECVWKLAEDGDGYIKTKPKYRGQNSE